MQIKLRLLILIFFGVGIYSNAQIVYKPPMTSEEIKIDGVLSEEIWKTAPSFSDFKSYRPDFGKTLRDSTFVQIAYDQENIYVAFICLESEVDKIKATVSSRDRIIADDWVCLNLDSRNDQLGTDSFVANPLGIQYDSWSTATSEDVSVDFVWYSEGKITNRGYTVEIKIPFKSLRFNNQEITEMGMLFERRNAWTNTHVTFPNLDPAKGNAYLTQLMKVQFTGIRHYNLLEILPSATYTFHKNRENDALITDINKPSFGLNFKYGFTSSLILDATLNPDFSQVESDAGQVDINLRTQLYFPEKRPFFMEGMDKFQIAATGSSIVDPIWYMVYTRNIVDPIAGIKFSGKIDNNNSLAILYSADELEADSSGHHQYVHYPVLRYKYNFGNDNFIGTLYTGNQGKDFGNQVFGFDGQLRLSSTTTLQYNSFGSNTMDIDTKHKGYSGGITLSRSKRKLDWTFTLKEISKDFSVSTGYYTRTGISQSSLYLVPKFYPDSSTIKKIELELFGSMSYDNFYSMWETFNHVAVTVLIGNNVQTKVKATCSNEIFLGQRFNTSGVHALLTGKIGNWFSGSLLYRRVNAIYYSSSPFSGISNRIQGELDITPVPKLNIAFSYVYNDFSAENNSSKIYKYPIERFETSYQPNKYLLIRYIGEYNGYRKSLMSDALVSFTYIPGTVVHIGFGSLFRQENATAPFLGADNFPPVEMERGIFLKASYLFMKK